MQIPILDANVIDYTEQGIANTSLIAQDQSVDSGTLSYFQVPQWILRATAVTIFNPFRPFSSNKNITPMTAVLSNQINPSVRPETRTTPNDTIELPTGRGVGHTIQASSKMTCPKLPALTRAESSRSSP